MKGQTVQNYVAEITCDSIGILSMNLQANTNLLLGELNNDSLTLYSDTSFVNRRINFSLNTPYCDHLEIFLHDSNTNIKYGFEIVDDEVFIRLNEFIIEGPFRGVNTQGLNVNISSNQTEITVYRVEYNEPEISFYLNDMLVIQSCIGLYDLNLRHVLLPKSGTNASVNAIFESY